jgi:hypothetical protein
MDIDVIGVFIIINSNLEIELIQLSISRQKSMNIDAIVFFLLLSI